MNRIFIIALMCAACQQVTEKSEVLRADFVDLFIGTDGKGKTYPGASVPYGMVQLSADNGPSRAYINGATLNGEPYNKIWLDHSVIQTGGTLNFIMSEATEKNGVPTRSLFLSRSNENNS